METETQLGEVICPRSPGTSQAELRPKPRSADSQSSRLSMSHAHSNVFFGTSYLTCRWLEITVFLLHFSQEQIKAGPRQSAP